MPARGVAGAGPGLACGPCSTALTVQLKLSLLLGDGILRWRLERGGTVLASGGGCYGSIAGGLYHARGAAADDLEREERASLRRW
jgi:hypothetical protein